MNRWMIGAIGFLPVNLILNSQGHVGAATFALILQAGCLCMQIKVFREDMKS